MFIPSVGLVHSFGPVGVRGAHCRRGPPRRCRHGTFHWRVQHWTDSRQRAWDIERIALLEESGWTVIRVSAEMLARPDVIIQRVIAKLRAAGRPI